MGGDIWYECNGGGSYTLFFAFYRDCDGVNAPNTVTINYASSCTGTNSVTLTQVPGTGQDITPTCPGQQSTCSGGNFPGVEKYVYSATVTLVPCADWVFSTSVCCRNNAITNINNPGGEEMYLQATLDNLNNACNSAPVFSSDPVPYICVGETFCFNHGAIDAEGDSMSFQLIEPFDQGVTDPVNYLPGYTATQPISSSPLITFDSITGDICMTPSAIEVSVTAVVVEHWNNGQLVGTIMRDIQIVVVNCNNVLPTVDGINATNNFTATACAGTPINFVTTGNDADAGNLLTMSWNAGIPGATFNIAGNGTTSPSGSFSWTPTLANVSNTPYCFTVTIQDDQCPLNGFQIYSFCITVGAGNVTATATGVDPLCSGVCDGQAVVVGAGGTPPYTYSTDGVTYGPSNIFPGLCPGTYDLYAMDSDGCANSDSVTLVDPPPIVLTPSSTDVTCNGGADGVAGVTVTGGTPPYSYSWSNGATTSFNTGLTAGTYIVTVTDLNGCIATASMTINEPAPLSATTAANDVTCNGNNGTINVNPAGGGGQYDYVWSHDPGLNNNVANQLTPGVYTVTVTDQNGCSITLTDTVGIAGNSDASFTYNGNQCFTGHLVEFTHQGTAGGAATHEWDFGDASGTSTLQSPDYTYGAPGNYVVEHIVTFGVCTDTVYVTVQVYTEPSTSWVETPVSCNGGSDGSIDLTIAGGTPNYGYFWNNGSIIEDPANLTAGSYTVIVSDNNGCLAYDTVLITEPTPLTASSLVNNAACAGVCNGDATINVSGGTAPYNYIWNDPLAQTTSTANSLCAGDYIVTATDANGCNLSDTVTLINVDTLTVSVAITPSTCGQADGQLDASPAGGTAPYSYLWIPSGQTTQTATGIAAGTYYLTVTDQIGCMVSDTTVVADIPAPTAIVAALGPVSCNGGSDGVITVNASGGTGSYSYSWSPSGGTAATATGLVSGFYTVTVTDGAGCITTTSAFVSEPTPITLLTGSVNANCGLSDGTVSVIASGGTPAYSYEWSDGSTVVGTTPILNVPAGTYYITVTDNNDCTIIDSVAVGDNPPGSITASGADVSCFGGCDGSAVAAISGGTPPYQFQWNDPSGTSGQTVVGLCAGTYTVTVTDGVGCQVEDSVTISEPVKLTVVISSFSNVSCFGFTDGSAEASATGGTPPYQYQWDANAGGSTTPTISGYGPGTYGVLVTDALGCTGVAIATITEPAEILLSGSSITAHCGLADGEAEVTITSGGVAPFSYAWTGSGSTTSQATGLPQGVYTATVTDDDGCQQSIDISVGDLAGSTATITNAINPTCFGSCDGSATVSISGTGTAPYSYLWDNSGAQTTSTATGLCAGITYTVTVTDANGCTTIASVNLVSPPALNLNLTGQDAICFGECTGGMLSNVTGGTPPYQYLWDDPAQQVTANAVNLCALTTYTLTITDDNGCVTSAANSIGQPTAIEIDSTVNNSFCGQSNGSACITISGGIPGYDVNWLYNGSDSLCQSALSAGTYLFEVTDVNDCPAQGSVTVTDISGPTSSITNVNHVLCASGTEGQATILVSGGTAPYSYLWDAAAGSQITPTGSNLSAGSYTYTVVDSAGCQTSGVVNITEPDPINLTAFHTNPICNGSVDGVITTTVFGGVGPYTYSWSHDPGLNSPIATGLVAGIYSVVVTDANGCLVSEVVTLTDPVPVSTSVTGTDVGCNGACTGTATATTMTGVAPFSYLWNDINQQTTQTASGLCVGSYQVIIADNNGCLDTASVTISQPDSLLGSVSLAGNVTCSGLCNGYAEASGTGGTTPYSYLWSNGDTTQLIDNLCPGNYAAVITDANGCTATLAQSVTQPFPLNGTMVSSDASCNGVCDGQAEYVISGGVAPYSYQWNDPSFQTTSEASSLCAGAYSVIVLDANGCSIIGNANIGQPTFLTVSTTVTSSNCGQNNGMACATISGGTAPYVYQWNDPGNQTTACALGIPAGIYNVVVTDDNNCTVNATVNVTDLSGPVISFVNANDVSCNGLADGSVEMNVTGGTTPYQSYQWTEVVTGTVVGFPNDPVLNNVAAGCYSLEVIDDVGCIASSTYCVSEPAPLNSTMINVYSVSCFSDCDGSATALFSGGTGPYNLLWDNGQTTNTVTNLCPGPHTLDITDANGCTHSNSVTINEPAPLTTVQVGSSSTLCSGNCDGVIEVVSLGGTAPYNYVWSPGVSTSNMATGLCAGNYVVQTTDANGCQIITNYNVTAPPPLTGAIASSQATCGLCNGTATLTASGGTTPYSYLWQDGQTTSVALNVCPGNFSGTIIDANGCQYIMDTNVINIPGPTVSGFNTTDLTCNGDNTGAATVIHTGGTAPFAYLWSPGAQTTPTASGLAAGTHCVEITDGNGCIAYDCATITQPNVLEGVPDQDATICFGDSAQIWASATGGTAPYTFQWLPPHGGLTGPGPHFVNPPSTQNFCFEVQDANGCISTNTSCIEIIVTPPLTIDIPDFLSVCNGDSLSIFSTATGGNGSPYTYAWYFGSPSGTPIDSSANLINYPGTPGTYYLTLNDGCSIEAIDSTTISLEPFPTANISVSDSNVCLNDEVTFTVSSDIGSIFLWDFDSDNIVDVNTTDTTASFIFQSPGTFDVSLTVVSDSGCLVTVVDSSAVVVNDLPVADFSMVPPTTTIINPVANVFDQSSNAVSWDWDFTSDNIIDDTLQNTSFEYGEIGDYQIMLAIVDTNGCRDTTYQDFEIKDEFTLYVPNSFTPNGDGFNDYFFADGTLDKAQYFKFELFDRWGLLLWEAYTYESQWDGTFQGLPAPEDVYVWKLEILFPGDIVRRYYGHVTLLK